MQPSANVEKQDQRYDEAPRDGHKDGFFASALKSAGLGDPAGFSGEVNEPRQADEDSIIHTRLAD